MAWQAEDLAKTLSFASVSSDGRVTMWNMSKSELIHQDIMELKLVGSDAREPEEDEGSCPLPPLTSPTGLVLPR